MENHKELDAVAKEMRDDSPSIINNPYESVLSDPKKFLQETFSYAAQNVLSKTRLCDYEQGFFLDGKHQRVLLEVMEHPAEEIAFYYQAQDFRLTCGAVLCAVEDRHETVKTQDDVLRVTEEAKSRGDYLSAVERCDDLLYSSSSSAWYKEGVALLPPFMKKEFREFHRKLNFLPSGKGSLDKESAGLVKVADEKVI